MAADGITQGEEHGVIRLTHIHAIEFLAPPTKQAQAFRGVADLIAKIVCPPAERVNVIEILVKMLRKEETDDVKVLVVGRCEPTRVCQRFRLAPGAFHRLAGADELFWGKEGHSALGNDSGLHVTVVTHEMTHHFQQIGQWLFTIHKVTSGNITP